MFLQHSAKISFLSAQNLLLDGFSLFQGTLIATAESTLAKISKCLKACKQQQCRNEKAPAT